MEWIKVKTEDELPVDQVLAVNIYGKKMIGYVYVDYYSDKRITNITCENEDHVMYNVTRWTPLMKATKNE